MNQLKRYLFWWVCGALLVVELAVMGLWGPSDAHGDDPETVKGKLDGQVKALNQVYGRATTRMQGVFNPEDPVDILHLTNDYLITPKWANVLTPAVGKYAEQIKKIQDDLNDRSKPLRDPLIETQNRIEWQDRYLDESEQVLRKLDDGGQLVVPEKNAAAATTGRGAMPMPADDASRFRIDERVRKVAGLETVRGGDTFRPEDHAELTARLRIVQKVADTLVHIDAETPPNPAVNHGRDALPTQKPRLAGWEWSQRVEPFKGPVATHIVGAQLATIHLQGAESALIAAIAALEQLDKPVAVVTSASMTRLDAPAGKRLGSADIVVPAQATIELLVLDMTQPTAAKESK